MVAVYMAIITIIIIILWFLCVCVGNINQGLFKLIKYGIAAVYVLVSFDFESISSH